MSIFCPKNVHQVLPRTKARSADSVASAVTTEVLSGRGAKTTATEASVSLEARRNRNIITGFNVFKRIQYVSKCIYNALHNDTYVCLASMKIMTVHRKMLQKCVEDQSRQGTEKTCKLRNGDAFTSRAQGELKVLRKVLRKVLSGLEVLGRNSGNTAVTTIALENPRRCYTMTQG